MDTGSFLKPMYEFFRKKLLEREFLMADETPLQVLHEPERRAQTKSYMCSIDPVKTEKFRLLFTSIPRYELEIMPSSFLKTLTDI